MYKWVGRILGVCLAAVLIVIIFQQIAGFRRGAGIYYVGVLPGADCAGLKTELTLYADQAYFLKETYLATRDGDQTFTSSGKWKNIKSGRNTFIQLKYDKSEETYNFLQKDPDHLVVVDKELKLIDAPINLTLTRK